LLNGLLRNAHLLRYFSSRVFLVELDDTVCLKKHFI